jgi:hypothetical protein
MSGAGFHLVIAATWSLIVLVGAMSYGARMSAALRSAAMVGAIAFALSYAADQVTPDEPDCFEQTPTGSGSC